MLINPNSGLKNSKNHLLDVIDIFSKEGYEISAYTTQRHGDAYNYLLENAYKYDVVCVFGGDGTMNEVTNALMKLDNQPMLGYFPSGTMNDFGSNFDLGNDFVSIAKRICRRNIKEFDVGQYNDSYFNYVTAFGAMCDVSYTTPRDSKEVLGNIAYLVEGISKLPEIKPNHVKYTINNQTYDGDILFGLIYSGNRVAGMTLEDNRHSHIDDGMFNVLMVDYVPTILNKPDVISTLMNRDNYIHIFHTDYVHLEMDRDIAFTLDGEKADNTGSADIRIFKKALRMLI